MIFNLKQSSKQNYSLLVDDKLLNLNERQIGVLIKNRLRQDPVVVKMFRKFKIDLDNLDKMKIQIKKLNAEYAETDADLMILSSSLFENKTKDWFEDNYFIVVHEIWHNILRNYEQNNGYFGDHEEIDAFALSIASLMIQGKSIDEIYNKVFPKIGFHFHDLEKARQFFLKLLIKAKEFVSS